MTTTFHETTGLALGSFGLGTFRDFAGRIFAGVVNPDGTVFDLSPSYADTHAVLDDWARAKDMLHTISVKGGPVQFHISELEARPVLAHPNMLCTGANYRQHVAEMMTHNRFNQHNRHDGESDESFFERNLAIIDRRAREGIPYFWTGLHSSLAGANDPIALPLIGQQPDWELEFGAVIAGSGRYLQPAEAEDLIAGYVMVNDLGTVDEFRRTDVQWGFDWVSKHQPGFKPCGPFMVPKEFVDLSQVRIHLALNGQTMQDWPISDMIFSPDQILSYASERIRLMPGDLLITGSPPGNGAMHGGRWLRPGDVIDSSITFLGRQRNDVVAEDAQGRVPKWGPFPTT
ncbi:fumarylacetoacetate hydrolase family protein [Novosphingobium sp. KACC 22771]|uniref:fumarylacetoacetate hydrolase family protein n=1 Tax=Novosphingobium sp. KACC 22771 TaxID=3025670 RepID=UPI002366F4E7|nr:fumarylacetoacetate hydrolase family protein [Novosphingobium sp. KACC 22771]WDF71411.1 fumarylacetoacetate hydrolase family protein [Novosphingobium sp. KACC 22771]